MAGKNAFSDQVFFFFSHLRENGSRWQGSGKETSRPSSAGYEQQSAITYFVSDIAWAEQRNFRRAAEIDRGVRQN
jgi:hypothetical protein